MKTLLFLLLIPFFGISQVQFTETIATPTLKKDSLYSRALKWSVKTFELNDELFHIKNAEEGKLIIKPKLKTLVKHFGMKTEGNSWATITILCTDGKYIFEIEDIYYKFNSSVNVYNYEDKEGSAGNKEPFLDWKNDITKEIKTLIVVLKKNMKKGK